MCPVSHSFLRGQKRHALPAQQPDQSATDPVKQRNQTMARPDSRVSRALQLQNGTVKQKIP